MASASLLKSSLVVDKSEFVKRQSLRQSSASKTIASPGRGILVMDKSTSGKRLASIGQENTEANRQAYSTLLVTAPGLGQTDSTSLVPFSLKRPSNNPQLMAEKWLMFLLNKTLFLGLVPLAGSNDESWCQGLDGLASCTAAYYQQGARFAKWRTVVSIPNGPSVLAVKEAAWVEPEILLDGDHGIDRTFEVTEKVWAEVFFYLAENNMLTPGAECKDKATPEKVADYTLKLLQRRIPPAAPGIMASFLLIFYAITKLLLLGFERFLSGGQSEVETTFNLNAINQSPNPSLPENVKAAQDTLLIRAKANSLAQLGKYTGEGESDKAKQGMCSEGMCTKDK
ncbi:hypothetical protein R3W88_027268 [Solanum pinnatisectum]|uniref:fructose-bisphosphate aldolase n=1 Tax=Solanum pinnatisectum TaxID=50273 RepID=A0AAV9LIC6_9SOLN|nr:hypothetical protein R3W88_027268 [Solanum pinnatisectum]